MKRILIILVLSVALGVLAYMYTDLKKVSATGPRFLTTEEFDKTLQDSINVVYRDIDDVKSDISSIEARLSKIEQNLGY
jgi:ubiquinone biosynthesis protein UbiJ